MVSTRTNTPTPIRLTFPIPRDSFQRIATSNFSIQQMRRSLKLFSGIKLGRNGETGDYRFLGKIARF